MGKFIHVGTVYVFILWDSFVCAILYIYMYLNTSKVYIRLFRFLFFIFRKFNMQLEYDEKGGSFYYFLLSFYVLLLIPFTIFVCRRKQSKGNILILFLTCCGSYSHIQTSSEFFCFSEKGQKNQNICHCYLCRIKRHQLKSNPWKHRKQKGL